MKGQQTSQNSTGQIRRRIFHLDVPLLLFLLAGWLLIFTMATLGLQRDTERWLSISLVSQALGDYSVDATNAPKLARVNPKIIEAAKEDARVERKNPPPTLAVVVPEPTPTATSVEPTPTPNLGTLTVSAGGPYSGEEGSPIPLAAEGFNSKLALLPGTVTYRWDLDNNGEFDDAEGASTSVTFHDEGEYEVAVQAIDLLGREATNVATVSVSNAPPLVDLGPYQVANEGEEVELAATVSDPGDDILFFEWDLGDGTISHDSHPKHTYEDDGQYLATLRVSDNDNGLTEKSMIVYVANLPPIVDPGPDQVTSEGSSVTFSGSAVDPAGDHDSLAYAWDFDYDGHTFTPDAGGPTASNVYHDGPANIVAALQVKDEDGGETIKTVKVKVNNVAPTITGVTNDGPVGEGSQLTLTVTATDVGSDTLAYAFDWNNDGSFEAVEQPASAPNIWYNQGDHPVGIRVDDGDGGQDFITTTVSTFNEPPVALINVEATQLEGSPVLFDATDSYDPGINDVLTYQWDFGDGSSGNGLQPTHIYADNGVYSTTLTLTDDSAAANTASASVTILNANPQADAGANQTVDEGAQVNFAGTATDPGSADVLTYDWDFSYDGQNFNPEATGPSVNWTYPDGFENPQPVLVALRIRDDDYPASSGEIGEAIDTLQVIVNNVPPSDVDAGGPYNGVEMKPLTLTAKEATDVPADTLTYKWDLDNDGTFETSGRVISYTWNVAKIYTVTLRVADEDGGQTFDTARVTISNAPPKARVGGPYTTDVNAPLILSAAGSSDPTNDPLTYHWDFGDGVITTTTTVTVPHTYYDDGVYSVKLQVDDGRGGLDTATTTVTVTNLPPTAVAAATPQIALEGSPISFDGSGSSDPGAFDTLSYEWNFGDGSPVVNNVTASHSYADNGVYTATLTVTDDGGASDTDPIAVTILNANPVANAGPDQKANEGIQLSLTGTATDPGPSDTLSYAWDFNYDGSNFDVDATGASASVTYLNGPATYIVALRVRDDDYPASSGEIGEAIDTLTVNVQNVAPIVEAGGPYQGVEGQPITLTGTAADVPADGPGLTYNWDLNDDGQYETPGQMVINTWNTGGIYTVRLSVTDQDGATGFDTAQVDVDSMPTADAGGPYSGPEGSPIQFNGSGSDPDGDPLTFRWNFGDGTTATGANPTHAYADNGNYVATLRVNDGQGGIAVATAPVTVTNVAPTAVVGGPYSGTEGQPVAFDGSGSSDPGSADTLTYRWDFGDGNSAGGLSPSHTYADNGVYTATLTVTDDDGGAGTNLASVAIVNADPTADAGGPYATTVDVATTLNGSGSDVPADPLTFDWDFEYDGSTFDVNDTGPNVTYTWTTTGNKTVALRVTDDDGGSTITTTTVDVGSPPTAVASANPNPATEGDSISFKGGGSSDPDGDPLTYTWDFGDGSPTVNGKNVAHTYQDNSNYTVTLQVDDGRGGQDTDQLTVQVDNAPPQARAGGPYNGLEGTALVFDGSASSDPGVNDTLTYEWDFGDGSPPVSGINPSHTYADNGDYTATLTVTDNDGDSGNDSVQVTIQNAPPVAVAGANPNPASEGQPVTFDGSGSTDPGSGDTLTYEWDFGDGSPLVNDLNPSHTYADNGDYTATLTVTDNDGDANTVSLTITVLNVDPTADAGGPYSTTVGVPVELSGSGTDVPDDTLTYAWDLDEDGVFESQGQTVTYTPLMTGTFTVTLQVQDEDGGTATDPTTVQVNSLLPLIGLGTPYLLYLRKKFILSEKKRKLS